jgi:hypothetical protein
MVKTCARCRLQKTLDEFYASRQWKDGRHPYCKKCLLAYQRERRSQRLDEANPHRRRWSASFVQHDYFGEIASPTSAYLAGLLAADGNVLERQRRVTLELSGRDEELVTLARDEIAPGFPIRRRERPAGTQTTLLAVTSTQLCADLARLHIVPRKSLKLLWPTRVDAAHLRFFLLGYFDGDGYITRSRNGAYAYFRWGLLGTKEFLEGAMVFIHQQTGIRSRHVRPKEHTKIYRLEINGADALVVDEWLHARTELGLARKRLTHLPAQADIAASSSALK